MVIKTDQEALEALSALIKYFIRDKTAPGIQFSPRSPESTSVRITPTEICKAISADWKKRRITHQIAADRIGTTKQTISNQLTGKRRFSQNMAKKFSDAFGYSLPWLLFGEGEMFSDGKGFESKNDK
jgi:hypothetical protein